MSFQADIGCSTGSVRLKNSPTRVSIALERPLYFNGSPLHSMASALPPDPACRELLEIFFDLVDDAWHYLHRPMFMQEVELFFAMRGTSEIKHLDPAWLALFANVLSRAVHAENLHSVRTENLGSLHIELHATSQMALTLAQWTCRPQARVIMV